MPELTEQMYCSQQIVIPPKFPYILKRYCKAAIKTQPYDLLRWSYEYFNALAENRPPPVKLRLEYPIYSTEGGLTRGCLKVLANQLAGSTSVSLASVRACWKGFCLDPQELDRIFCLCEVFMKKDSVLLLHFIAVAGGLLTKTLTHTMILLCETLTKEPDGGSAAIPVQDFLEMYHFLAQMDASKDVKYYNGYREGLEPEPEPEGGEDIEEEEKVEELHSEVELSVSMEDSCPDVNVTKIALTNDKVPFTTRLSLKLKMPVVGMIKRSPSMERASEIERENFMRERKGRAAPCEAVDRQLKEMSDSKVDNVEAKPADAPKGEGEKVDTKEEIYIIVTDEDDVEVPYAIFGEPKEINEDKKIEKEEVENPIVGFEEQGHEEETEKVDEAERIRAYVLQCYEDREERWKDLENTFEEIALIVDKFKNVNYDLGMIAGRQMSTTSGEFIVQHIEREIMDYVNEQIAVLPDPDLKRKKAKPEEVAMIKSILNQFIDENMELMIPEVEEVEEEEGPIPVVTMVYAVPGIGPSVDEDIIKEFEAYVMEVSIVQDDVFMPRNIRHFLCPPMEKYIDPDYEAVNEEVPMGGVITD